MIDSLAGQVEARSDQLGVLETLLVQDAANRKFLPTRLPIADSWFCSNFGYRIDPFTGQNAFHEGVDFPAEAGTTVVAAASGKVVADLRAVQAQVVEIDHVDVGLIARREHSAVTEADSARCVAAMALH